ncbi:hypothetical protein AOR13_632 [Alteromonas stellipolaris LMG 21856]|nr:hypothetical protein AOR13_632 [Alteromonas stellipolaris LMG 21856]
MPLISSAAVKSWQLACASIIKNLCKLIQSLMGLSPLV